MISPDHTIFLEPQLFVVCPNISKREQKDCIATVTPDNHFKIFYHAICKELFFDALSQHTFHVWLNLIVYRSNNPAYYIGTYCPCVKVCVTLYTSSQ